jgi:GNAT acetyltransferase-like protein
MSIKRINPSQYPVWDDLLLSSDISSFFHTAGWSSVLAESYAFTPIFFTQIDNGGLSGLIALMEVNSPLTGKRGVSLPFTDQCEPIADDRSSFNVLFNEVVTYGQKVGWKTIELRGGHSFLCEKKPAATFLTHCLELNKTEKQLLASFRGSTKRNIKKAQKNGVIVNGHHSAAATTEFYRLNCLTRKDHGLPPQPNGFFQNLNDHIISKKKGRIFLAKYSGKTIAGAVFTIFGNKAIYKYGASDRKYQHLRANNLIMWEAIREYAAGNCSILGLGRTEPEHAGLLQFKRGWGTREKPIYYYKYDLNQNDFVTDNSKIKSSYPIFTKMPIPMLKLIGRLLYRHIA